MITLSMTEGASNSFGSGTGTGQLSASVFILSSSVQLRQHEGYMSIINMALVRSSKISSQDAYHLQTKSSKAGRSSYDFR